MQRVLLWSMLSFPLLIAGYVLELLGILSCIWFISFSSLWISLCFLQVISVRYIRCSFLQATVYIELYVHHGRSIRLVPNCYLLHSKFIILDSALINWPISPWFKSDPSLACYDSYHQVRSNPVIHINNWFVKLGKSWRK